MKTTRPAPSSGTRPPVAALLAAAAAVLALLTALSWAMPEARGRWLEEDGPLEWAAAVLFAVAGYLCLKRATGAAADRVIYGLAGLFCVIAALDELSFGERIFGFTAPEIRGIKIDGLHDLLDLFRNIIKQETSQPYLVAGAVLLAGVAVAALAGWRLQKTRFAIRPGRELALPGAAFALLVYAQLLDINFGPLDWPLMEEMRMEEILETTAGLLMTMFGIARPAGGMARAATRRPNPA